MQVYRDRDQFASLVREVAAPDVGRMGIEILSFTIKGNDDRVRVIYVLNLARLNVLLNKRKDDKRQTQLRANNNDGEESRT